MNAARRLVGGLVAAQILAFGAVMHASTAEISQIEGLCNGLAEAIARSTGLAKLILQVIAAFFGCS